MKTTNLYTSWEARWFGSAEAACRRRAEAVMCCAVLCCCAAVLCRAVDFCPSCGSRKASYLNLCQGRVSGQQLAGQPWLTSQLTRQFGHTGTHPYRNTPHARSIPQPQRHVAPTTALRALHSSRLAYQTSIPATALHLTDCVLHVVRRPRCIAVQLTAHSRLFIRTRAFDKLACLV